MSLPRVGALKAIFSVLPPHDQPANNNSPDMKESSNIKIDANEKLSFADAGDGVTNNLAKAMDNGCKFTYFFYKFTQIIIILRFYQ